MQSSVCVSRGEVTNVFRGCVLPQADQRMGGGLAGFLVNVVCFGMSNDCSYGAGSARLFLRVGITPRHKRVPDSCTSGAHKLLLPQLQHARVMPPAWPSRAARTPPRAARPVAPAARTTGSSTFYLVRDASFQGNIPVGFQQKHNCRAGCCVESTTSQGKRLSNKGIMTKKRQRRCPYWPSVEPPLMAGSSSKAVG